MYETSGDLPTALSGIKSASDSNARRPGTDRFRRFAGVVAARVEALLWLAGAALLATALWMKGDALWYQHRAEGELAASPAAGPATASATLEDGAPLALLSIPRLDLSAVVAEGVSDRVLRRAIGHLPASARPGEAGNVALAAHRDTFFRALEEIRAGDVVVLESGAGIDSYEVEWTVVVEPRHVEVTQDAGYPALTLVTCYPFRYVGDAPYRFVIRARRLDAVDPPLGATS